MAKKIRFTELVKHYGKPESVTLWTKPEDNPAFKKAMKENRVLTVIRKSVGTKKDVGYVGFLQEHSATYLVFPKKLPETDAEIIGINYDLLQGETKTAPLEPFKAPKIKARPKPSLKKFRVTLLRIASVETSVEVEAINTDSAEEKALEIVRTQPFKPKKIQEEIKSAIQLD